MLTTRENLLPYPQLILNIFVIHLNILEVQILTHKTGGAWNINEKALHINYKELLAVYYSLRSFKNYFQDKHVKIFSYSQVRVQIMNRMGTTESSIYNDIVKNIWLFCVKNKI